MPDTTTATVAPDLESLGAENLQYEDFERSRETGQPPAKAESPSAAPADAPKGDEPPATTAGDSETPDEKKQDAEPAEAGDKAKKGGVQKRIDQLTRDKRDLEARLAAALEAKPAAPAAGDKPADKPAEAAAAPKDDDKPKSEDFEHYDEYVDALTDWKADQREKTRAEQIRQSEAQQAARAAQQAWEAQEAEAKQAHADYDQALEGCEFKCSQDEHARFAAVVHDFERGPELLYHLATHPDDLDRIIHMGPIRMAGELGKIESSLSAKPVSETKPASEPKPKPSGAPKPVTAIAGGKGMAVATLDDPNLPYDEWERKRDEQLLARRR